MKKCIHVFFYILIYISIFSCSKTDKKELTENEIEPKKIKLVFTGDIMTHPSLVKAFENEDVLKDLKKYFEGDIVFANLEFVVNTNKKPMPYPEFNGSKEYLEYFTKYFNMFSVANNHAYDQGPKAETETISILKENGITVIGGETNGKYIAPIITNINGIPLFISAYTMLDNGLSHNNSKEGYTYNMNFYSNKESLVNKVKEDIKYVLPETIKIVSLHFGLEYTTYPEKETQNAARSLIENGVDIVVGHHPHVPRPVEIYEGTNKNGIIIYSLGNFIANHKAKYPYLDIGTIVSLEIKDKKEVSFSFVPTYYAFFKKDMFKIIIKPLDNDPKISMPQIEESFIYSEYDTNAIRNGYMLIHEFYSPLTNSKVSSLLTKSKY